jgi:hypothetical protein
VYFGLTFVRTADGPVLGYHLSWHKPASPLLDALQALHDGPQRHRWLTRHVQVHVLDRGTQGDPALRWALSQSIPYLTLSKRTAQWRRFEHPTHHTDTDVPIFVRRDSRLGPCTVALGRMRPPRTVVFPAHPDAGTDDGRALRYRTAAALTDAQITTLDQVYKARWPGNEHPIKALVAVGFDRNLDRTLELTPSRGHDGEVRRQREQIASLDTRLEALRPLPLEQAGTRYVKLSAQRANKAAKLAKATAKPETKGTRRDRGGEHLCKLLTLLLYNALAVLLWRSPLEAVRHMTAARVRELLLSRSAEVTCEDDTIHLVLTALYDPTDRAHQQELIRLFESCRLRIRDRRLTLRLRDPPEILRELRIAA